MLYRFVRPLARIGLALSYRKIYFSNEDRIPKDKPVLLAANHPTAFIEPCLLACFQKRSLYFMVRGDLFKKPFYIKLLNGLHMVPIFRLKDGGYKKLKNNYDTFEFCYKALNEQKTIMILAEGRTIHEKRLRSIQKGTARIAFGSYEAFGDLDVHIVPVGVNYTYAERFRGDVMIDVGEPMRLRDYLDRYKEHANNAIGDLTADLENRLGKHVIIIDEKEDEALVEKLFILDRNSRPILNGKIVEANSAPLFAEKELAASVNEMDAAGKTALSKQVNTYFSNLKKHKVDDLGIAQAQHYSAGNSLIMFLGLIPYGLGLIGNALPMMLPKYIADTKVKAIEFKMSVRLAASLGTFLVWYVLLLIIGFVVNSTGYWIALLLLPILGYFSIIYKERYLNWRSARAATQLDQKTQEELRAERAQLMKRLKAVYSSSR